MGEPPRRGPLIERPPRAEPDWILRILVGGAVALLGFICNAAYNGNRELGEIRSEVSTSTQATDRRITSLESTTDRRISALETATDRRLTALEQGAWTKP